MKKLFTLLTAFAVSVSAFAADATYVIKATKDGTTTAGTVLETDGTAITATANFQAKKNKDLKGQSFSDGTAANFFSPASIQMRLKGACTADNLIGEPNKENETTSFTLVVSSPVKEMKIYYEGAASDNGRSIMLFDRTALKEFSYSGEVSSEAVGGTNKGFISTVTNLAAGTYTLYCRGFGGGFCGIKYTVEESTSDKQPSGLAWSASSVSYKVRDNIEGLELPSLVNPNNLTVTYSTSNPEIAAVDEAGNVTLSNKKEGTATIEAIFAGDETYEAAKVGYIVNVLTNVVTAKAQDPELVAGELAAPAVMINAEGALTAGQTVVDDQYVTVTAPYDSKAGGYGAQYLGQDFKQSFQVRTNGAPTAEDVTGGDNGGSTPLIVTPKENMTFVVYGRRQSVAQRVEENDDVENNVITKTSIMGMQDKDGKSLHAYDQAAIDTEIEHHQIFGVWNSDDYMYVATVYNLEAGHTYTFAAISTTYQVNAIGYTVVSEKAEAGIEYSAAEAQALLGEENELPVLANPNNLAVVYASSDEAVATVNEAGTVTIVAAGTTTITATTEATDEYLAGKASYTLTVVDPNAIDRENVVVCSNGKGEATVVNNGFTLTREDGENIPNYSKKMNYEGKEYVPFKIKSNVAYTFVAPEGKVVTAAKVLTYINSDGPVEEKNISNVAHFAGEDYTVETAKIDKGRNEDYVVLNFDIPSLNTFTYKTAGKETDAVFIFEVIDAAHVPAQATATLGETELTDGTILHYDTTLKYALVFTPAAEHHEVYYCYENDEVTLPSVEEPGQPVETADGEETIVTTRNFMGHEYVKYEGSLDLTQSGHLRYFTLDPKKNVTSPVHRVSFAVTTGVENVATDVEAENAPVYNVYGQRVDATYRGIVIKNGRKYVQK